MDKTREFINFKKENFLFDEEVKLLDKEVNARKGKTYLIFFC